LELPGTGSGFHLYIDSETVLGEGSPALDYQTHHTLDPLKVSCADVSKIVTTADDWLGQHLLLQNRSTGSA